MIPRTLEEWNIPVILDLLTKGYDVAPKLIVRAPDWTKTLHYRILNDDSARALYKELLHSANSESRDVVYQLLKEIAANESPPLSSRAESVLTEDATLVN